MVKKVRLAVFASGTGTNFQALNDAIIQRNLNAEIVRLVVDHSKAGVLNLAKVFGVPATWLFWFYGAKLRARSPYATG